MYRSLWDLIRLNHPTNRPSQDDAVLVFLIGNRGQPDIARKTAMRSLASDDRKDLAVKRALITATRIFMKVSLKVGLIG